MPKKFLQQVQWLPFISGIASQFIPWFFAIKCHWNCVILLILSMVFFTVYGKFAITCEVVAMADHLQELSGYTVQVVPVLVK